jgi:hypothetical protein
LHGTFVEFPRYFAMNENFSDRPPQVRTAEERQARDAKRRVDAEQAMREHEATQRAFYQNHERLRAERLAREARGNSREAHGN